MWTNTLSSASGSDSPDYTYCLLVPAMVLYLLFEKRSQITQTPIRSSNPAIVAILIGLLLFWIGSRAGKQYIGCAGIQILILGIIFWFWGGAMFHRLFFTWAIICFAWPLPFLDTAVAFPLRMIVSRLANLSLNLVGIPSIQNGTALLSAPAPAGLPLGARFQIDIADPCSGLHSLLPLLMFSAFFCYFFLPKPWQQWTVFLTTPLFMIVGNVVRILMLVIGCITWGSSFSIGTGDQPSWFHEGCGFAVFVLVLGLECIFGYSLIALGRRFSDPSTAAAPAQSKVAPPPATGDIPFGRSGIIFTLVLMVAIVYLVTPPVYLPSEAGVLMTLPDQVKISDVDGGDFFGSDAPVSDAEHRLLPKDTEFSRKNYDDFHDHQIFFSIVLSGLQQYTIHPPEICLVAQGWSIVGQEDIPIRLSSGHKLTVRNLSLQREVIDARQQHRLVKAYYMYWYVADDITTPSHTTRNWMSSWDRVVHNRDHRWAYVIAMSPITQTIRSDGLDAEQTRDMLTSFIRQIIPTFQKNEIPGYTDNS
jgi:EpsI family protein